MLPSVHVTSVLFLVLAGNSALELHALTLVARSYALLTEKQARASKYIN